jgi:hypothetical protein
VFQTCPVATTTMQCNLRALLFSKRMVRLSRAACCGASSSCSTSRFQHTPFSSSASVEPCHCLLAPHLSATSYC